MTYAPAAIEKFGGLRLSTDPGDVSLEQSLAGVNCTLGPDRSFLRSRDGTVRLGAASAMTGDICQRLIPTLGAGSSEVLLAVARTVAGTYLDSYDTTGAVTALANWSSSQSFNDAVSIGLPAAQVVYIAASGATLRKHTLGVVATGTGKPKYLSVTPTSNRLVQAHYLAAADSPSGANGTRNTVFFSDAGDPDTYQPNNYVMLQPGDGSDIRGIASWGRQVFVFKEADMFVFGGESIDATGQPIFDYRAVSLPSPVAPEPTAYGQVVASGALGVYYVGVGGIYRTTGGPPVKVSGALSEGFRVGGAIRPHGLSAVGNRVLIQQSGTIWELDERHGEWMSRQYPQFGDAFAAPWVQWPAFANSANWDTETLFYGGGSTLLYTSGNLATDDGSAVATSYQSGYGDLGAPGIKRLRQSVLAGTGSVRYSVGWDYAALDTGSIADLGPSPEAGYWMDRQSRRGRLLSFGLSAASGGWRVNSIQLQLGPTRSPAKMVA